MKRSVQRSIAVLALALPLAAYAEQENYTLDPTHTYPNFTVEHWQLSMMYGRFNKSSGKFSFDRKAKTGSVELAIETASIDTGDNEKGARPRARDEHLRAADFFNAAEFPRITFRSTKVGFGAELPSSVEGNLMMNGVTRPVSLQFERFRCVTNPFNKKARCGGNATGKIKRSDFGMKYGIPGVGDEIALNVEFEGDKD
ncbi:MAG: polyisoprenoid-binding protein [Betaproteobacteria bacterium]|nr:polyisoprenoid-binding protein [Betaproteobacteria bacterium]